MVKPRPRNIEGKFHLCGPVLSEMSFEAYEDDSLWTDRQIARWTYVDAQGQTHARFLIFKSQHLWISLQTATSTRDMAYVLLRFF